MTREQRDGFVIVIEAGTSERGHGMWAVKLAETGEFIGCAGLLYQTFDAHFTPAFEIAYRFARSAWARLCDRGGEGGSGVRIHQRRHLHDRSMTAVSNTRSHDPADDFDHPRLSHAMHCARTCCTA
ncbi:hypothetical protein [Actinopolymorpha sp. B9G3]|uniref:GNAT family N-acetyltransferase n=1 Tax=Actinopolymorpha sp. B9G3 TaxID=3158970 RepID=UPI0032D92E8C